MADREKLTELANDVLGYLPWGQVCKDTGECIADRMIDHGVVVPVRCEECKHSRTPGNTSIRYGLPGTVTCSNPNSPCHYRHTKGEDYCPYGERKEYG